VERTFSIFTAETLVSAFKSTQRYNPETNIDVVGFQILAAVSMKYFVV
jgi:hypothetical protein